jgi:uncharacterized protein
MVSINISNLADGIYHYFFNETISGLGFLDERFPKPLEINVMLDKSTHSFRILTKVKTPGHFVCDRCLDDFDMEISEQVETIYVRGDYIPSDEDDEFTEIKHLKLNANEINLNSDVHEAVLLAVPMKLLCRIDCAGLCPNCGTNRNHEKCNCSFEETDPRWNALKKLL